MVNLVYHLSNTAQAKIMVTDVTGKLIRTVNVQENGNQTSIDLSDCHDGIYFIHLYSGDQVTQTQKIAIRH
jgi:hypothetical protein